MNPDNSVETDKTLERWLNFMESVCQEQNVQTFEEQKNTNQVQVPQIDVESPTPPHPSESLSDKIVDEFVLNGRTLKYLSLLKEFILLKNDKKFLFSNISEKECNDDLILIQKIYDSRISKNQVRWFAQKAVEKGFPYKEIYEIARLQEDLEHQEKMNDLHMKIKTEYEENKRSEKYLSLLKEQIRIESRCIPRSHFILNDKRLEKIFADDISIIKDVINYPSKKNADLAIKRGFPAVPIYTLAEIISPLNKVVEEYRSNGRSEKYLSLIQEFIKEQKDLFRFYDFLDRPLTHNDEVSVIKDIKLIDYLLMYKGDGLFDRAYVRCAIDRGFPQSVMEDFLK